MVNIWCIYFPKKRNPFCPFRHGPVWPFTNAGLNIQRDPFGENNVVQLFPTHRIYEFGLGGLGFIIDTGWQMVWPGFGWQFVSLSYTATRIAENPPIKRNAPHRLMCSARPSRQGYGVCSEILLFYHSDNGIAQYIVTMIYTAHTHTTGSVSPYQFQDC